MKINKQRKYFFIFWTKQGLILVLYIYIQENQGSCNSKLKICLMMFDILILKILYFFLYFHKFIWNKTFFIDLLTKQRKSNGNNDNNGLGFLLSALMDLMGLRFLLSALMFLLPWFIKILIFCGFPFNALIGFKVPIKCSDVLLPWFSKMLSFGGFLLSALMGSDGI